MIFPTVVHFEHVQKLKWK